MATRMMWDARHSVRSRAEELAFSIVALHARWIEGLGLYNFTLGDGSLDAHAQFAVEAGFGLSADWRMDSATIDPANLQIAILYKAFHGPLGWNQWDPPDSPVETFDLLGTQVWNNTATQTIPALLDGEVMFVHYFLSRQMDPATGLPLYNVVGVCGQVVFPDVPSAQAVAEDAHRTLDLTGLPFQEMIPLATVIVQHDSAFANQYKLRIIPTDEGLDYVDLRNLLGSGTGGASGGFPGYGGAPPAVDYGAAAAGIAPTVSRSDHNHDLADHASEHLPSGGDPITTAAAVGVGGGNAAGVADSLARSDHGHAIRETGGPTDLTVGAIANGEIVQRVGAALVGLAAPVTFPGYGLVGNVEQIDVGDAAGAGVSPLVSRADHQHAVPVPGLPAIQIVGVGTAGASAKVAREDHVHPMSALAPAAHAASHAPATGIDPLATAIAGTIAVADTAATGTADSLSRSDHRHALPAPGLPAAQVVGAGAPGASTKVAREDHVHPQSAITAVQVGYTPTTPGDWYATVPTEVLAALDRLAKLRVLTITAFSATPTFDFTADKNWHKITLTANITAITLTAPRQVGTVVLEIVQDGTGGWTIATSAWPATCKWAGGVKPTFGDAAGTTRLVTAWFDGTNYHCEFRPETYIA